MSRHITFAQAINECLHQEMSVDPNIIVFGLGVNDPKAIFGTTDGLEVKFGKERVFDIPTAENGMTGVGIGAALQGIRPVMVHQRLDFFLLAMDQLVNAAAKWRYMFGGQDSVPITIRLIIGRGWGQGPTHSQNLQAWFAHIPGLKVVMPASANDAKGLLASSIADNNPVLFLEHRWLHNMQGDVPEKMYKTELGKANLVRQGDAVTIVAMSYMTIEAIRAADFLSDNGITCDVLDLRTVRPLDWDAIFQSVSRTGRLIALDTGHATGSIASEIIARVSIECWSKLKCAPIRIAIPDYPEGTSFALTINYHPRAEHIVAAISKIMKKTFDLNSVINQREYPHDVPGDWFKGPF